ncbi:MAG: SUMF1/EgtB/PvdO family nonheme iron enzyme [Deltaproteobacteria bacterium]|nr:SUMF1/EgtB/PvdO family nonheme iron enzyme [Deltaproteobacteria bacterium]
MKRWSILLCLACVGAGCGGGQDGISVRRPELLSALDSADVYASLRVCRSSHCDKPDQTLRLEPNGDRFTTSVKLWPDTYFLELSFLTDAFAAVVPLPLASYPEQEHKVDANAMTTIEFSELPLNIQHDVDGDGIVNLDEAKFDFDPAAADADHPEEDPVQVATGGEVVRIGSYTGGLAEYPLHEVTLLHGYRIDRFEVSEDRYRRCVAMNKCRAPAGRSREEYLRATQGSLKPAVGVTQEDARQFCLAAGGALPTEAEWEYAARPDSVLDFPWVSPTDPHSDEWCNIVNARWLSSGNEWVACKHSSGSGTPVLVDVNAFMAVTAGVDEHYVDGCARRPDTGADNHEGPCQMAGNAWEWTASEFRSYVEPHDWLGLAGWVTIRGGSADSTDTSLYTTFRFGIDPELAGATDLAKYVGFRCLYYD